MTDYPAHMWQTACASYGRVESLEKYYPQALAANPLLQHAVMQIKMAEAAIDSIMSSLADVERWQ